jgi:[protein-PII] uridylyltransferase
VTANPAVSFRDAATTPPDAGFPASPTPEDIDLYRQAVEDGKPVPKALLEMLETGIARTREAFEGRRLAGIEAGIALTGLQDHVITALFEEGCRAFPLPHPTSSERVAVVAVGGYGRGLLAPGSDIDLLFLTPYKRTGWTESVVETILYGLWDLKQKVGQATRSTNDCTRLAREDMTIRTSLLETRLICGDEALYEEMRARLWSELFEDTKVEFATAKLDERRARHERG